MKNLLFLILLGCSFSVLGQNSIKGILQDGTSEVIPFSNIVLYSAADSSMVKVESSDVDGKFTFQNVSDGSYYLVSTFVGYDDYNSSILDVAGQDIDLGVVQMITSTVQLETAVVKAKRALVEVKPDRTVFNVEGTINSVGDNALGLLRKAPGVLVDNNNNISVLSRSGVLIYVDGKRLPLAGDDLTSYLENLPAY